jgi:hypothetical protein
MDWPVTGDVTQGTFATIIPPGMQPKSPGQCKPGDTLGSSTRAHNAAASEQQPSLPTYSGPRNMECPTNSTLADSTPNPTTPERKPQKPAVVLPDHNGTDSGYGTGADSTPGPENRQFPGSARSARTLSLTLNGEKGETVKSFDHEVLPTTIDRFKAVCSELEPALVNYMVKHYTKHAAMAIRMMVLGQSSEDAEPCMVVFCPKKRESRVRRFFDTTFARDLCRPSSQALPSFKVVIVPRNLQPLAAELSILWTDEDQISDTLSGAPVKTNDRFGTLGGLLKLNSTPTEFELYGITAAHILKPQNDEGLGSEEEGDDVSSSDDQREDERISFNTDQTDKVGGNNDTITAFNCLDILGVASPELSLPLRDGPALCTERDWTLVDTWHSVALKPNRMRSGRNADLLEPSQDSMESCVSRSVVLNVSRDIGREGVLIGLPASIWLDHTGGFTRVMTLEMSSDFSKCQEPRPGKCS